MTYKQKFLHAIESSKRLGSKEPIKGCVDSSELILNDSIKRRISDLFQKHILNNVESYKEVAGECGPVNSVMKSILEEDLGLEVFLTLGYISIQGKTSFGTPLSELEIAIKNRMPRDKWKIHIWLTLPSTEVIDLTLFYSLNEGLSWSLEPATPMILMELNSYDNGTIELHPLLVGEEVIHQLFKIKTIESSATSIKEVFSRLDSMRGNDGV